MMLVVSSQVKLMFVEVAVVVVVVAVVVVVVEVVVVVVVALLGHSVIFQVSQSGARQKSSSSPYLYWT